MQVSKNVGWLLVVAVCVGLTQINGFTSETNQQTTDEQENDKSSTEESPDAEKLDRQVDEGKVPRIEMAILLDTSGSMNGLIDQARTQLWKIVNEFALAQRNGKRPELRVALYEYGNSNLPREENWVRLILPFTSDLDKVSEELFALTTRGGNEYCGAVIGRAVEELDWSREGRNLKCIFIAGNEPFSQGPIDFRKSCALAANSNITVSTIHCGDHDHGLRTHWGEGAKLADGSYMSINQDQVLPDIPAPQDQELIRLNAELNKTFVAYGAADKREEAVARQLAQDNNAVNASCATNASRVQFKCSRLYDNSHWDLVDAWSRSKIKVEEVKEEHLPEELRKMDPEARKTHIESLAAKRKELQAEIKTVSVARSKFIAEERKKLATADSDNTLDIAILDAVRRQAAGLGFEFSDPE